MYHLVGKGLKVPFWDRMQKNRVLKMFFDFFLNRVAEGGAAWDPIALLAKEHIGITSSSSHRFTQNLAYLRGFRNFGLRGLQRKTQRAAPLHAGAVPPRNA